LPVSFIKHVIIVAKFASVS